MQRAFSLVELSIVLVILGLLVGGVLAGQSLIRAAELRSVVTEFQRYQAATNTFRDKYFALPGDMTNATAFWGTMPTGTCPNASGGTGTQTCNGNGNGQINGFTGTNWETHLMWQHLANAGLIEGVYTGIWEATYLFGKHSPTTKVASGNSGWSGMYRGDKPISDTQFLEGSYGNTLELYRDSISPILTAGELWNIDTKIDDGKIAYGLVRAAENTGAICTSVAASNSIALVPTAVYNLSNSQISCTPVFANVW